MKKLLLTTISALALVACSGDKVYVDTHGARIDELERRADLNDQLDAAQDAAISANASSIEMLQDDLAALEAELLGLIADEEAARIAGDEQLAEDLANAVDLQSAINFFVQLQIAAVNSKANLALSRISSLRNRVEDLENDVEVLQDDVADLQGEVDDLQARMSAAESAIALNASRIANLRSQVIAMGLAQTVINLALQGQIFFANFQISLLKNRLSNAEADINGLALDISALDTRLSSAESAISDLDSELTALGISAAATQAQLDQQGVQVYKCDSPTSEERLFKINGKFYAVMNRVTTKQIKVITGSSSQSYSLPNLCKHPSNDNKIMTLTKPDGTCRGNRVLVPGETVTVPAFTTQNVRVVDSVKMAMELLEPGNYITTDGSVPGCQFSITSGNGSTNLVLAQ